MFCDEHCQTQSTVLQTAYHYLVITKRLQSLLYNKLYIIQSHICLLT